MLAQKLAFRFKKPMASIPRHARLRQAIMITPTLFAVATSFAALLLCTLHTPEWMDKLRAFTNFFYAEATRANLPFCEAPFEMSPYVAQGASGMAHLPFVQSFVLAIADQCPEIFPMLIPTGTEYQRWRARKIRETIRWQFALMSFSGIAGHFIPNPRMLMAQEVSIILSICMVINMAQVMTDQQFYAGKGSARTTACLALIPVLIYLAFDLMPLLVIGLPAPIVASFAIKGTFGLLTDFSKKLLLLVISVSALTMAMESATCHKVNHMLPWPAYHVVFDILFWQVLGSIILVILIAPAGPTGRFLRLSSNESPQFINSPRVASSLMKHGHGSHGSCNQSTQYHAIGRVLTPPVRCN